MNGEKGFSLVELTLAAFLTVGLMASVFVLMRQNQTVFVNEYGVKDMEDNVRVCIDLLTRDVQSSGSGLTRAKGNFPSIFYNAGSTPSTPDSILIVLGDIYAPYAGLSASGADTSGSYYDVNPPPALASDLHYTGANQTTQYLYQAYSTSSQKYIIYDNTNCSIFTLTSNGLVNGNTIRLRHASTSDLDIATTFQSAIDTGPPDPSAANVALLDSTVAYRLNTATKEIERSLDLINWYAIARGVNRFKLTYRCETRLKATGNTVETTTAQPGIDYTSAYPGQPDKTSRKDIRSVIVSIEAETPDALPGDQHYRTQAYRFEITPRNLNLLNNNNLSSNVKARGLYNGDGSN